MQNHLEPHTRQATAGLSRRRRLTRISAAVADPKSSEVV